MCVCVCVCFQDMIIGIILQIESYLCHLSLLHILTNENSGNNYSHSFEDSFEVLTKHFFIFILFLVFRTSWFGFFLSVEEGIVRKLAKCLYLRRRRHQIHCLTWAPFISLAWLSVMLSHGVKEGTVARTLGKVIYLAY